MKQHYKIWEAIRVDWVNGNRKEAADSLLRLSKLDLCSVVAEAILTHHRSFIGDSHDGTLTDLLEILNFIRLTK